MKAREVRAPDGAIWTVRRQWTRRPSFRARWWRRKGRRHAAAGKSHDAAGKPVEDKGSWPAGPTVRDGGPRGRKKGSALDYLDLPNLFSSDGLSLAFILLILAVAVVFMIFVGVPLILLLLEVFFVTVPLLVLGIVGRVLFRRPWTLEATTEGRRHVWRVVGWGASTRALERMQQDISAGRPMYDRTFEPPTR